MKFNGDVTLYRELRFTSCVIKSRGIGERRRNFFIVCRRELEAILHYRENVEFANDCDRG